MWEALGEARLPPPSSGISATYLRSTPIREPPRYCYRQPLKLVEMP